MKLALKRRNFCKHLSAIGLIPIFSSNSIANPNAPKDQKPFLKKKRI
jgi:hypothetical protein